MNRDFKDIVPLVAMHTTTNVDDEGDLPFIVMLEYVRNAALELFRRSGYFKRWVRIKGQQNVSDYPLELPSDLDGYRVIGVNRLLVDGEDYDPSTDEAEYPRHDCFSRRTYWYNDKGWININPSVRCDEAQIDVYVTVVPTSESCSIPESAFEDYREVIAAGALSKLLNMSNYVFYNPRYAIVASAQFEDGVKRATVASMKGRVKGVNHERNARRSRNGKSWFN